MTEYDYTALGGSLTGGQAINWQVIQAPGGLLTGPLDAARNLISSSATFQTMVSAGDQPTAKLSTFLQIADETGEIPYEPPYAIVIPPPGCIGTNILTGPYNTGPFKIMFVAPVPATYADSWNNIVNWFGGIMEGITLDVWNTVGTGAMNQLLVRNFVLESDFQRAGFTSGTDYVQCYFRLDFGATQG